MLLNLVRRRHCNSILHRSIGTAVSWKCGHCLHVFLKDKDIVRHLSLNGVRLATTKISKFAVPNDEHTIFFPKCSQNIRENALLKMLRQSFGHKNGPHQLFAWLK